MRLYLSWQGGKERQVDGMPDIGKIHSKRGQDPKRRKPAFEPLYRARRRMKQRLAFFIVERRRQDYEENMNVVIAELL